METAKSITLSALGTTGVTGAAAILFDRQGEHAVYEMQCRHLVQFYGDSPHTRRWFDILYAEIIGQQLYHEQHRQFPVDQRAFVERFLAGLAHEQIIAAE
jgi:hypothetical protein